MKFLDTARMAGTRRTADGYVVADVRTARIGIQLTQAMNSASRKCRS
ncbi:hypothetical protein PYH37_000632 [Sinorhizobium numidicum]|uniref:Uncharacterized protein n=1 Tax=Sinorhizobium numidicum TaxID=680248 RepID=A0ABY8CRG1_9HYPH|nr:hypothetical protein [Sinorhizobium numidicum]WEX75246.1 hypothetical protein PYH37_000632 [Sinorhizobium numidicum]WEX81241.1 hypothetical protein PYH38_000634 [Sinorhizobium numidicum]